MNAFPVVYTRGYSPLNDYRVFCLPTSLVKTEKNEFLRCMRGAINTEGARGTIEEPRWCVFRRKNLVLFGVGVLNSMLPGCKPYSYDFVSRRIRCFTGIFFDVSDIKEISDIPLELNYYAELFIKYIDPIPRLAQGLL